MCELLCLISNYALPSIFNEIAIDLPIFNTGSNVRNRVWSSCRNKLIFDFHAAFLSCSSGSLVYELYKF